MALSQQKFREIVFQLLFSEEIGNPNPDHMIELMMEQLAVSKKNVKSAHEKALEVLRKLPEIDPLITSVSIGYDFNRIHPVAKNILLLGVYELLYDESIPPKVAIAEALRLARKFGTSESGSFINALLDHLYQASQGFPKNPQQLEAQAKAFELSEEEARMKALESQEAREQENPTLSDSENE